jgi:proteasome lid subunit RPN8/RPN11
VGDFWRVGFGDQAVNAKKPILSKPIKNKVLQHIDRCYPEEACGLLVGQGRLIRDMLPIENVLHSKELFRMEPQAQYQAFEWMETQQYDLIGIFHSHPDGPPGPSERDIQEYAYPDAYMMICSPADKPKDWQIRAYRIINGTAVSHVIEEIE